DDGREERDRLRGDDGLMHGFLLGRGTGCRQAPKRRASPPAYPWELPERKIGQGRATVIPAETPGRSIASRACAAPSRSTTSPTSRAGSSRPSAIMSSIAG